MDIFDRINELLLERRITGARMSKDLGFSSGLFSQWKARAQTPSADKIQAMADYFKVSADYLLNGTGVCSYDINSDDGALDDDWIILVLNSLYGRVQRKELCKPHMGIERTYYIVGEDDEDNEKLDEEGQDPDKKKFILMDRDVNLLYDVISSVVVPIVQRLKDVRSEEEIVVDLNRFYDYMHVADAIRLYTEDKRGDPNET